MINPIDTLRGGMSGFSRFGVSGVQIGRDDTHVCREARAADVGVSLPCQSSNNSAERCPKLSPYQRKNAVIIRENLDWLIAIYGVHRVGFLTLTFAQFLTLQDANRRLNSMAKHVLSKHFVCWVCVREFTKGGRPHFHLVVVCRDDIREGFNFENYLAMAKLWKTKRSGCSRRAASELSRRLNPTEHLRGLWASLRTALPIYGFGRAELIPIRKPQAIAFYVGGYIRKSMEMRPESAKGARLVSYSESFPRKINSHAWQWNTDLTHLWRRKLECFAKLHGITEYEGLGKAFGPKWAFWLRDLIESMSLRSFTECSFDLRVVEMNSLDPERFNESLGFHGFNLATSMHHYRPRPPMDEKGRSFYPPRALADVFAFHCRSWFLPVPENAAPVAGRRASPLPVSRFDLAMGGLTNLTSEMLEERRSAVLQPVCAPRFEAWNDDEKNDPWWAEAIRRNPLGMPVMK